MGRDDLSTGGAETMNAASTQPRSFDVLCAGLAVGNVVVRPVPEHFSGGDTVQVQEISMMGGVTRSIRPACWRRLGKSRRFYPAWRTMTAGA